MRLDIKKIDDRIAKLQELRRIASDPELVSVLAEFVTSDDESAIEAPPPPVKPAAEPTPAPEKAQAAGMSELDEVVRGVLEASAQQTGPANDSRSGLFSRRR